jgi:hypothetical protein
MVVMLKIILRRILRINWRGLSNHPSGNPLTDKSQQRPMSPSKRRQLVRKNIVQNPTPTNFQNDKRGVRSELSVQCVATAG